MNVSPPARAILSDITPWYANAWITRPAGVGVFGLVGWAFIARLMVVRRKREAEQLRERMLEQERIAKAALEQEVAERKRAEEYYLTLVESIPHIVIRKNREGRYTFVNSTSRQWAGFQGRDMIGKDDFDLGTTGAGPWHPRAGSRGGGHRQDHRVGPPHRGARTDPQDLPAFDPFAHPR